MLNKLTASVEYYLNEKPNDICHIAKSYYHAENLCQYSNDVVNVKWSIDDHHLFGKYVDNFVILLLKYHKYGKFRKYIPKGILFMIIRFIL